MKILLCHNFYQEPGGEDRVFADEGALLESRGHDVVRYIRHNDELARIPKALAAAGTVWNGSAYQDLARLLCDTRPDVCHFHNTFPLISPAGYYAAGHAGVPVVQTLHNYRLACPNALFFRDGHPCEDCVGKLVPWPGVVHRCYRGSAAASATVAAMLAVHRLRKTWTTRVRLYVALTEFARRKLVAAGLPASRVVVKPNGLGSDPGAGTGDGGYVLYVGRLTPEKGIRTLLRAWQCDPTLPPLKIVGDGPLADEVRAFGGADVELVGQLPPAEVSRLMAGASCLVMPSEWYETFGRVVVEAFAVGTPVLVSDQGAAAELVEPGRTGEHFRSGDAVHLASTVRTLLGDPEQLARMRRAARGRFESDYSADASYRALMNIYRRATDEHTERAEGQPVPRRAFTGVVG